MFDRHLWQPHVLYAEKRSASEGQVQDNATSCHAPVACVIRDQVRVLLLRLQVVMEASQRTLDTLLPFHRFRACRWAAGLRDPSETCPNEGFDLQGWSIRPCA